VPFQAFELSPEKHSALETARILGVDPSIVFKTIVVVREKKSKPLLVVIPARHIVDLKALAALVHEKKLRLPTQREAEQITGMQAGGISPLGLLNKGFQVILDEVALSFDYIHISGGERGLNIRLPVQALVSLTNATCSKVSTLSIAGSESQD